MDRLLWYVFAATRGGATRVRIVQALLRRPTNPNVLARELGLDYKTVEYNLRVLTKHVFVTCQNAEAYGAPYMASKNLLAARADFDQIASRLVPVSGELGKGTSGEPIRGVTK